MARSQPRAAKGITAARVGRTVPKGTKGVQDDPKSRNDNAGKMPTVVHVGGKGWAVEASHTGRMPKRT